MLGAGIEYIYSCYDNTVMYKLINTQAITYIYIYTRKYIHTSSEICEEMPHHEIELKAIAWSVEYSNKDLFPSAGIQQVPRY